MRPFAVGLLALVDCEREDWNAVSGRQREIGAELYLALNEVKPHTSSIFRKLGASSRERAVAEACELELI